MFELYLITDTYNLYGKFTGILEPGQKSMERVGVKNFFFFERFVNILGRRNFLGKILNFLAKKVNLVFKIAIFFLTKSSRVVAPAC
jgi:hypothetical protein